jgi:hypothetical protein
MFDEEPKARLETLRTHLAEGAEQARREEFVEYSLEMLLQALDDED